ncbi:MAG: hypothetical protein JW902_13040 [Syntrophaceae bacterium]|nr:hypothetical protein [Syntrophaceae bacterium]
MKKYEKILCCAGIMVTIMIIFQTGALASDWKIIGAADGIIGYTKNCGENGFQAVRAVGMIDAPVAVIEAVLRDVPSSPELVFKCKSADFVNAPNFKNTPDSFHIYMVTAMPFPLNDRDGVHLHKYSIDKTSGTIYLHIEAIKTDYKLTKDMVRVSAMKGDYVLVPKGVSQTEVTFTSMGDPGGSIPIFITDLFTKNLGIKTIASLRTMVCKDKYKNIKTIITTTSHVECKDARND